MSGHCEFCGVWHSGSCCHPARQRVAELEAENAELREANKRLNDTISEDQLDAYKP